MNQVKRKKRKAHVEERDCVACGCCVKVCPMSAIQIFHGVSGGSGKMCWLRKVCKSVSGNGYFNSGGGRMKKSWYDYLWIASLMYLVLGFFQILFAWLGLLCFFIPLIIAIVKGNKGYCNRLS